MYQGPGWPVGDAMHPEPSPSSFSFPLASISSPHAHHGPYRSNYYPEISEYRETGYYNAIPSDVHQASSLNSDISIGPDINLNPNSNVLNNPYSPSDLDMSQYPLSPEPRNSPPQTPSTSEGTGYSTTPPGSGFLMSHQLVPNTCRSKDPDLQQLAGAIVNCPLSLGLSDLYIAQFFSIKIVSGITQPATNRRKRREKPRPKNLLAYHCLWCERWVGYSKEKARQHFLVDLNMKGITCGEPECTWKTARPSDFTRHMKLVHKKDQPKKKSGGAMQPGTSFMELQKAYKNGKGAFPVDASQNSSYVSATTNGLTPAAHIQPTTATHPGWIGAIPQFSAPTELYQVCLTLHTQYNWPRWVWGSTASVVPRAACAVVYSACVKKLAEPSNSTTPKLTADAKSKQPELFPWSAVISSVLGVTIMTFPPQIQNNKNSKNFAKRLTTSVQEISYCSDHSSPLNLRRALSEPKRRGLHPNCHPNKDSPAMFPYAFSSHACKYIPLSTATIGNQRRGFLKLLSTAPPPNTA